FHSPSARRLAAGAHAVKRRRASDFRLRRRCRDGQASGPRRRRSLSSAGTRHLARRSGRDLWMVDLTRHVLLSDGAFFRDQRMIPMSEPSEALCWRSIADLVDNHPDATVALIGAPLNERSLTPGRCDLGPKALRGVLPRLSTYDVETGLELEVLVHDAGDVALKAVSPLEAFEPVRNAVAAQAHRDLTILVGGNNAITRPGVHALGLDRVGVLTLDAHFDLRDTDQGLTNGNPIQALLDDGMDGHRISQVGLAPF